MKRIIAAVSLAAILVSCGTVPTGTPTSAVSVSTSAEASAEWLSNKLGGLDGSFVLGVGEDAESYGVDLSGLRDDGYVIRKQNGTSLIFGKTESGLDRAVRRYYKDCADTGSANITYGEGYRVKSITVADRSLADYAIRVIADDDDLHALAASELRKYLGEACGVYPEIVNDDPEHGIYIVQVKPDSERYATLGDEGFTVEVDEDGDLYIYGGQYRGCLYGVYGFLEDHIGYRFMYDCEQRGNMDYLYEADRVDIPAGTSDTQVPSFALRDFYYPGDDRSGNTYLPVEHLMKLKYSGSCINSNRYYNGYQIHTVACHGIQMVSGLFPDYSRSDNKQPCFTSEENIEIAINGYKDYLKKREESGYVVGKDICEIDVAQDDFMVFCECSSCMEYINSEGGYIGPVLYFTNELARAFAAEYGEDFYVKMLSYWGTTKPPKNMRPEKNVNVSYCFYNDLEKSICYNHCIDGSECVEDSGLKGTWNVTNYPFAEELKEWSKIANRLTIWYYPGAWDCYGLTSSTIKNLRADMAFLESLGTIEGIFLCPWNYKQTETLIDRYLLAKLMWDATISEEEYWDLIEEYIMIYGGGGAKYIVEYLHSQIDDVAGNGCWSIMAWSAPGKRVNLERAKNTFDYHVELFDRAVSLAETAEEERFCRSFGLSMYFTGLISTHTDWYLEGDEALREKYTRYYDYFTKYALEYKYYYGDVFSEKDVDIEKNLAELMDSQERYGEWWK